MGVLVLLVMKVMMLMDAMLSCFLCGYLSSLPPAREGTHRQLYRPSNRGHDGAVSGPKCLHDGVIWNCKVILLENVARHWLRDQIKSL